MSQNARKFYTYLSDRMKTLGATDDKDNEVDFFSTVEQVSKLALEWTKAGNKLMFIGNGGSAAISS